MLQKDGPDAQRSNAELVEPHRSNEEFVEPALPSNTQVAAEPSPCEYEMSSEASGSDDPVELVNICLPADTWQCRSCTLLNSVTVLVCVACNEIRPDPTSWACLRCQTCSPATDNACVGCGLALVENESGEFEMYVDSDSDCEEELGFGRQLPSVAVPTPMRVTSNAECRQTPASGSGTAYADQHAGVAAHRSKRPRLSSPSRSGLSASSASSDSHVMSEHSSWRCQYCTFENYNLEAPVCEICGNARKG